MSMSRQQEGVNVSGMHGVPISEDLEAVELRQQAMIESYSQDVASRAVETLRMDPESDSWSTAQSAAREAVKIVLRDLASFEQQAPVTGQGE